MKEKAGALASFGKMAALSARGVMAALNPRVELPPDLFPAGNPEDVEGVMRAAGVSSVRFKIYRWKEEGVYTSHHQKLVMSLAREDGGWGASGDVPWGLSAVGHWAFENGLRLELRPEGARWTAGSKRAAAKARWSDALGPEGLGEAAAALKGFCEGVAPLALNLRRARGEEGAQEADFPQELRARARAFRKSVGG